MKNRIKEVLEEKGITQKELAQSIGMSEVGISKAVNGSATLSTLQRISNALSISVDELKVENDILLAKYGSDKTPLQLGNLELPCYVLENGMRVFSGRGLQKILGAGTSASGTWLLKLVNSKAISTYLAPDKLEAFNSPINFIPPFSKGLKSMAYGYEVTLLIDLCNAIIDAYDAELYDNTKSYMAANVILRAVAKVGIIALVDEVTGYNKDKERAKDELQKFLKVFLSEEASKWVKTFNDRFFEDLYRMRNWDWTKTAHRPGVVGKWINDIVYERIGPLILAELRKRNPKNENGNRKYKFHQLLSTDIGKPRLQQHLEALHAIAVSSNYKWAIFMHNLDKIYPKQYQELSLFDDEDFEIEIDVMGG